MNALAIAESAFCLRWAEALVHFLWQGLAIAALAAAAAWSLRRASARARYAVYLGRRRRAAQLVARALRLLGAEGTSQFRLRRMRRSEPTTTARALRTRIAGCTRAREP